MSNVLGGPQAPSTQAFVPGVFTPGQVLTADQLNQSFAAKTDNSNAAISGGTINGVTVVEVIGTTPSTSPTTGALTVAGGTGIVGDLNVGGKIGSVGDMNAGGNLTVTKNFSAGGTGAFGSDVTVGGVFTANGAAALTKGLTVTGGETVNGTLHAANNVQVDGNENINGNLTVAGQASFGSISSSGPINSVNNPNLQVNASGELGVTGWTLASNVGLLNDVLFGEGNGFTNTVALATATSINAAPAVPIGPNVPVQMSFDVANGATAGAVTVSLTAFKSDGTSLGVVGAPQNITNGSALTHMSFGGTTPANTASVVAAVSFANVVAPAKSIIWRRIKVEAGTLPSSYSMEATAGYMQTLITNMINTQVPPIVQPIADASAIVYAIALG